jgi:hypothetical protein
MATAQLPNHPEQLSGLDRRQLLASGAAVATAIATSDPASAPAKRIQTAACSGPPARQFCDATARRLREIARRNEIRTEAKLPVLSIPSELRRMKPQEILDEFGRFEAVHGKSAREQMLKARRVSSRREEIV